MVQLNAGKVLLALVALASLQVATGAVAQPVESMAEYLRAQRERAVIEQLSVPTQQAVVDSLYAKSSWAKIFGGQPLSHSEYTSRYAWMVALSVRLSHGERQFCGGTLISERWVLTAAHCDAFPNPEAFVTIRHGSPLFSEGNKVGVKRIVRHPQFSSANTGFDVALVELAAPIVGVRGIALAGALPAEGASSVVLGWGKTAFANEGVDRLQRGTVLAVELAKCQKDYAAAPYPTDNWQTMTCAAKLGVDSCQQDSGGPLVVGADKAPSQFGIVSFGEGCADPKFPGVYASVPALREWIRATSGI